MRWGYLSAASLGLLAACGEHDARQSAFNGYAEAEYTRVAAPLAGRLVRLSAQRGMQVQAGSPLFVLEQEAEKAALQGSQARVQRSQAVVRDLDKGARPDELAAAQAAVQQAQASLEDSQRELKRQGELAAQGFTSGSNLDALVARRDADAARVRQLQAQLRSLRLGARSDAQAAAQADIAAAQADVAQNEWRVQQKSVVAPVNARVEDTLYRAGEWVAAGAPVVSLLEPGAIKLRFFVPEGRLAEVQPGRQVQVACDGCGAPMVATVRHVSQQAEFTPPVIYSKENRGKLVFLVEAWPAPGDATRLHPGQPVDVTPDVRR